MERWRAAGPAVGCAARPTAPNPRHAREQHPQRGHRGPRRPREDHPRRRPVPLRGHLPAGPGGRRAGDGLERAGARARDHDPRQEHGHHAAGAPGQHRRHARARRLRWSGGADPVDGGRRPAAGRLLRGPDAADALRPQEGLRARPQGAGDGQQDRPPGRPPRRSAERGLRPLRGPRRDDEQLDFPILYGSGRDGWASTEPTATEGDLGPLAELLLEHVPFARTDAAAGLQFQAATLDHDDYLGRIAVGRVHRGVLAAGARVWITHRSKPVVR